MIIYLGKINHFQCIILIPLLLLENNIQLPQLIYPIIIISALSPYCGDPFGDPLGRTFGVFSEKT